MEGVIMALLVLAEAELIGIQSTDAQTQTFYLQAKDCGNHASLRSLYALCANYLTIFACSPYIL